MISRNKLILINKAAGFLKILSINNTEYFLDIRTYEVTIFIKSILNHEILKSLSDFCKEKNVNCFIDSDLENGWKFKIKIY